ncbi:hypothetical protein GGR54DRAFT_408126 [Hypoxylon sp. NC1633]|nr:hypothetical protein GGR54DRAFT_408126 [Hypoxylon sp. NC1633]
MSSPNSAGTTTVDNLPHDNRSRDTIIAVVLCIVSATTAVSLRLYTRYFIQRRFGADDYLVLTGTLGMIANGVIQLVFLNYGLGAHYWDLTDERQFWKMFYVLSISYNTTLLLIKFALFCQYYRLIQEVSYYRRLYLSIMAVVGGWVIAQEFILIFPCTPIHMYWDHEASGTCLDGTLTGWMNGIGNLITDVIILVLPIPVVWRLNLKSGKRWAVIAIFALGFFTCIVSICRLVFFATLGSDFSYDVVTVAAWGEAEAASGLICSSLMSLGPLFRRFSHHFRTVKKTTVTPNKYTYGGTNPFSRHTANRDKSLLRTNGSRKAFDDGSETELNRLDVERSRKADLVDDGRSIRSTKSSGMGRSDGDYSDAMPDLRLGLETGIRTIISTGNRDSIHSQSLPDAPKGIVVKQVWSVRNKESNDRDEE